MNQSLRIVIADDHPIVRDGFHTILDLQEGMSVTGTASDGHTAVKLAESEQPDVVLMDLHMPGMDGIAATRQIRRLVPHTHILIITSQPDDDRIIQALQAGANGFLLKDWDTEEIIRVIYAVKNGQLILPAQITAKLQASLDEQPNSLSEELSEEEIHASAEGLPWGDWQEVFSAREKQIIFLLLEGRTNSQMAELLHLSVGTIKNYISAIYRSLKVEDRAQAIEVLKRKLE